MKKNKLTNKQTNYFVFFIILLFIIDRFLKYLAFSNKTVSHLFFNNFIGWEYFANTGVAFSIPIPQFFLHIVTPIFLILLYFFIKKEEKRILLAYFLVLFGALSNFIDRVVFNITIDYIRIIGSVFNIADIMILIGIILIIKNKK